MGRKTWLPSQTIYMQPSQLDSRRRARAPDGYSSDEAFSCGLY